MPSFEELSGIYEFDANHSRIGFEARHAMITKVHGTFRNFTGMLTVPDHNIAESSIHIEIQVDSVDTGVDRRNSHLRTNEVLDVAAFPTITFASTAVRLIDDDIAEVTGDLTIRDVTKPITVAVTYLGSASDANGVPRAGFEASAVLNRGDYGVTYNKALEAGGVLISERIKLEFDISAIRQNS